MSGNVSTANNTSGSATSDANQTFNTATAYNNNAQNTLSQVNGANTPLMNQVGQTAQSNLSSYQNNFLPLQQQQISQAQNYTSDQNTQNLQGEAEGDSNASLQASLNNQRASLASEGVDPASVGGSAIMQQAQVAGAAQTAQAANQSYVNTQNTGNQMVANANQLGMQVGQAGTTGAQAASGIGTASVANVNSTNATGVNNLTAANPYLTTATNANQSGANIANTQFQDQLISQQAQQASSNSNWAGIGTLGGMALGEYANSEDGGMAEGGVVGYPKPVMQHPGALPWQNRQPGQPLHFDEGGTVPMFDLNGGGGGISSPYGTGFDSTGMGGGFNEMGGGMAVGNGNPNGATPGAVMGLQQNFANAGNWDAAASPVAQTGALPNYGQTAGAAPAPATPIPSSSSYDPTAFGANVQGFANGFAMTQKGGGGGGGMATGGPVSNRGALPTSPIPGSTDTKPAWLTPGEFVIPRDVASWKGHEHWYKQMDKARGEIAQRHGLPPPPSSAMTTRGS